jgi:hypothetical protein
MKRPMISQIVCLPDLLSNNRAVAECFFDLVREPIRQGCSIDIGYAPGGRKPHGLLPGFELERFQALAGLEHISMLASAQAATYYQMPDAAQDYLFTHVPASTLLLTCEIPPWLRRACLLREVDFLDFRQSPLNFGRDMWVALDSSNGRLRAALAAHSISDEELRLEAALLGANMRMHRARRPFDRFNLDDAFVLVGQSRKDVALLSETGHVQCLGDFAEHLHKLAAGRHLLYIANYDYFDKSSIKFATLERESLASSLGVKIDVCTRNAYEILCAHDDVALTGVSAPMLQEAVWFDKPAHSLAQPFTPLGKAPATDGAYLLAHFNELLAPAFWHRILTPGTPAPRLARLPMLDRHLGRETLEVWGEYDKVLNYGRHLPTNAFEHSGAHILRRRIERLETAWQTSQMGSTPTAMQARIRQLKNSKQGQTAYILGNGPSLLMLDIKALMNRESFWFNKAFALETLGFEFRPKYYFLTDISGAQLWLDEIMTMPASTKFFYHECYDYLNLMRPEAFKQQDIIAYETSWTAGTYMHESDTNFSYDPSVVLHNGTSTVLLAIQYAFYMGYARVLVGGVDLDYSQPYFHGGKTPNSLVMMNERTSDMYQSFLVAKMHFEKYGRLLGKITPSPNLPLDFIEDSMLIGHGA